jgi:hypothetical protein
MRQRTDLLRECSCRCMHNASTGEHWRNVRPCCAARAACGLRGPLASSAQHGTVIQLMQVFGPWRLAHTADPPTSAPAGQ